MLRRIPELFAFVDVSHRIGAQLFEVSLQNYATHCWYGGIYRGERPAAILKTSGSDTVAHCLAFATMHLVQRVCDSNVRGYDAARAPGGDRAASRLAGLFASLLVDRIALGMSADRERIGIASRDPDLERTLTSYRAVAEIMYPDSREMRAGISKVDDDPMAFWQRAIDHALFLNGSPIASPAPEAMLTLVRTICDTLDSFYIYFLATSFGDAFYERYGI